MNVHSSLRHRIPRPRPEPSVSPVVTLAGSAPVRSVVNAGFHLHARLRKAAIEELDPIATQDRVLRSLVRKARSTRFGRDHGFDRIHSVADFQSAVPLRTYEALWNDYLRDRYPVFEDLTWPGRIPFLALTSGTTQGATKYIPVSREMVASNRKAAQTMVAYHLAARPGSRLFHGRLFFLGGTTALEQPAPGVHQGDLSGIAALELTPLLAALHLSAAGAGPRVELGPQARPPGRAEHRRADHAGQRRAELAAHALPARAGPERQDRRSARSGPSSSWSSTAGSSSTLTSRPSATSSAGATSGSRRPIPARRASSPSATRRPGSCGCSWTTASSTSSSRSTSSTRPRPRGTGWGTSQTGRELRHRRLDLRGDVVARHRRHRPVRVARPAAPPVHRPDQVHALGVRRAPDQRGGRVAIAAASSASGASVRDWHVGPVFEGALGYHQYVVEFLDRPADAGLFRQALDADLSRRNADYLAHRAEGVGLPLPALLTARPGAFESWMRSRGKLGGQNKVPRMDGSGNLTRELVSFLRGGTTSSPTSARVRTIDKPEAQAKVHLYEMHLRLRFRLVQTDADAGITPPASSPPRARRSGGSSRGARRPPRGPRR